jgi:3-carboxy-cis,cis-muconate cycloisomerase
MSFAATGRLTDLIGGTSEMNAVWSARQTVQSMLDVEAALARATAAHGVIPSTASMPRR